MPPTRHPLAITAIALSLLASCTHDTPATSTTTLPGTATTIVRSGIPQRVDPNPDPQAATDERTRWANQTATNIARATNATPEQTTCLEQGLANLDPADVDRIVNEAVTGTSAPGTSPLTDLRTRCGLPPG